MPFSRKVTDREYKRAISNVPTTRLMRWCIHMVRYGYKAGIEIESNIIKIAANGE